MRRLTIADITGNLLLESGRSGFISDDTAFLRKVFVLCVNRGVMKNSEGDWAFRVLSGIENSQAFVKSYSQGKRVFTLKAFDVNKS